MTGQTARERMLERKRTEGSRPILTAAQVTLIAQALYDHPDWFAVYLFYDGHIERDDAFVSRLSSRQAGINSINTDGIPAHVSRGHSQIEQELAKYAAQQTSTAAGGDAAADRAAEG